MYFFLDRNTHYQERYENQPEERMHIQQIQVRKKNIR